MLTKIFTGCGVGLFSVLTVLPVNAQEMATLVLSDGQRPSGELVELDARGYTLRVNGKDQVFAVNRVAAVEYVAPALPPAVQARIDGGESLLVLRSGQVIPGRLVDIGGTRPKRLTVDTPSGQRTFLSDTVAQIYLFPLERALVDAAQPAALARMRFDVMDRNNDGAITRDEWRGSPRSFDVHDWNGDGRLSGDEVRIGAQGADVDDDRGDQFEDLDANGNGRIERAEWHASEDAFTWLDRNRDGTLSRLEVTGEELATSPRDQFASLDYDGNGTITRNEWHWSLGSFTRWDLNGDGELTRQEFAAVADSTNVSTPPSRLLYVNSQQRWTDTGVTVRAGDVLTFSSQGTIQMSADTNDVATSAGSRTGRRAPSAPVNAVAGALIARIGDAAPFLVGDRRSIPAPVGGRLYLGVNDDHLPDNIGEFQVTVAIQGGR